MKVLDFEMHRHERPLAPSINVIIRAILLCINQESGACVWCAGEACLLQVADGTEERSEEARYHFQWLDLHCSETVCANDSISGKKI